MGDETETGGADGVTPDEAQARPRRSPGRPRWKTPAEKLVSRQIYMSEGEWQVCRTQGNASAFLRRLVREFVERQRGGEATGTTDTDDE